jgi:hypothetical protein
MAWRVIENTPEISACDAITAASVASTSMNHRSASLSPVSA